MTKSQNLNKLSLPPATNISLLFEILIYCVIFYGPDIVFIFFNEEGVFFQILIQLSSNPYPADNKIVDDNYYMQVFIPKVEKLVCLLFSKL